MYNMKEVDVILAVEINNGLEKSVEKSKNIYKIACKKMDDLLVEYHLIDNIDEKNTFAIEFMRRQIEVEITCKNMEQNIRIFGNRVFDASMIKKNRFSLIIEELIQKAMSPSRLEKHLELGGDMEDF